MSAALSKQTLALDGDGDHYPVFASLHLPGMTWYAAAEIVLYRRDPDPAGFAVGLLIHGELAHLTRHSYDLTYAQAVELFSEEAARHAATELTGTTPTEGERR
jgi:hypothetical protein